MAIDVCSVRHGFNNKLIRFCVSMLGYGFYGDVLKDSEARRWMGPHRSVSSYHFAIINYNLYSFGLFSFWLCMSTTNCYLAEWPSNFKYYVWKVDVWLSLSQFLLLQLFFHCAIVINEEIMHYVLKRTQMNYIMDSRPHLSIVSIELNNKYPGL